MDESTSIRPWRRAPASGLRVERPDELLHRTAALAGLGAWSCELPTERLSWTPAVYRLFGLPEGERLERRALVDLYEAESRRALERVRSAAIQRGEPFWLEAQIIRPDGERRWLRITAEVVHDHGRPVRLYGLKHDITAQRAAQGRG